MAHPATGIQINAVYEPGDHLVFVYSHNNGGGPEFLALNVPKSRANQVAGTINFLAAREIKHGESANSHGLYFLTNEITGQRKSQLGRTHMTATDPRSPYFELVPRFDCSDGKPENWGSRPAAPLGREDLVDEIIDVWNQKNSKSFILYVNGKPGDCRLENLKYIDLAVALRHVNDWKVDWDMHLSSEQVAFVREHNRYFSKLAKVLFRSQEVCAGCGLVDVGRLMRCQRCKDQWYCGATCQRADWQNHKPMCTKLQALRNNQPIPR